MCLFNKLISKADYSQENDSLFHWRWLRQHQNGKKLNILSSSSVPVKSVLKHRKILSRLRNDLNGKSYGEIFPFSPFFNLISKEHRHNFILHAEIIIDWSQNKLLPERSLYLHQDKVNPLNSKNTFKVEKN